MSRISKIKLLTLTGLLTGLLLSWQSQAQEGDPEYAEVCLQEATKDSPDMDQVREECSLAAKYFKQNGNIGNASWIYLINDQWDAAMALDERHEQLDSLSVLYMNQGHIAAMQGDLDQAEMLYRKHINHNARPIGEGFEDDLENVLPKLFPNKRSEIRAANRLWLSIYRPIEEIDELYEEYNQRFNERDFNDSIELLREVQAIKLDQDLGNGLGYFYNQMTLSDLVEISARFDETLEINQQLIDDIDRFEGDPAVEDWLLRQIYRNIGRIQMRDADYAAAIAAFEKSDDFILLEEYYDGDAQRFDNQFSIAAALTASGDLDAALATILLAIDDIEQSDFANKTALSARFKQSLGNLYAQQGDYELAIDQFEQLIDEQRNSSDDESLISLAYSYADLARAEFKTKSYADARAHYELAINLSVEILGNFNRLTDRFVRDYIIMLKSLGDSKTILDLTDRFNIDPDDFEGLDEVL